MRPQRTFTLMVQKADSNQDELQLSHHKGQEYLQDPIEDSLEGLWPIQTLPFPHGDYHSTFAKRRPSQVSRSPFGPLRERRVRVDEGADAQDDVVASDVGLFVVGGKLIGHLRRKPDHGEKERNRARDDVEDN
ncbi:hypothetical protein BT69DRAFT_1276160 [Atractiella rhizophila]|nr:hypothetical protein BT69DRAFT_1276160 [Atractiella rhizophila]